MQSIDISQALESWYARHNGNELCASIRERLEPLLRLAFGYHLLQIGPLRSHSLVDSSPINHRIFASPVAGGGTSLCCHGDELPLESDSVDFLVAFHALEFDEHPHGVLREMQRVLRPYGHLLIVGFNPYSLLGLSQYLRRLRGSAPWNNHRPVSPQRLSDWLRLVDCEIEATHHLYPIPLIGRGRLRGMIEGVDNWSAGHGLPGGSVYITHAIKRISGVRRPRPLSFAAPERLVGLAVAGSPAPTPRQPGHQRSRAA